jgi:hypothetical protein
MTFFITWKKSVRISGWFIFQTKSPCSSSPLWLPPFHPLKKVLGVRGYHLFGSFMSELDTLEVGCVGNGTPKSSVDVSMARKGSFNGKRYGKMIESICHRIGWWENFNRKAQPIWW